MNIENFVSFCARCTLIISSFFGTFTLYNAYIFNENILGILSFISIVSSINYWRLPCYGWRRNMDFISAFLNLFVVIYLSDTIIHKIFVSLSIMLFIIACNLWKNNIWYWYWIHFCFHIIANISNYILYYDRYKIKVIY